MINCFQIHLALLHNGTAVIALLQPTPEVFNQFDQLLLMREAGA